MNFNISQCEFFFTMNFNIVNVNFFSHSVQEQKNQKEKFIFNNFQRRGWDSNPRKVSLQQISSLPHSTTLPPLHNSVISYQLSVISYLQVRLKV